MQLTHLTGPRSWSAWKYYLIAVFTISGWGLLWLQPRARQSLLGPPFLICVPWTKSLTKVSVWFEFLHVFPKCFSSSRSPTITFLPFWTRGILNAWANGTTLTRCPYTGMVNWEHQVPGTAEIYCLQLLLILMYHQSNLGSIEAEI